MKSRLLVVAALFSPVAASAAPADVNAETFYANAVALQAKGMTAMFDKRLKPMVAQMKDAGARARALNQAADKTGKPLYCVPEAARKKGMSSQQVVALLGQMPAAERRTVTLAEAWKRILIREYPCR